MIQYETYDPATDDLFLYEDHVITWSNPEPGSATVKRAYAWNPNSSLYGYRKSLEGLAVPYRTFSTAFPTNADDPGALACFAVNDPLDPVNKPIYFNSYPPMFRIVGKRLTFWCAHCFNIGGPSGDRIPGATANQMFAANTYLASVLKYRSISADGQIHDIDLSQMEYPYYYDTVAGDGQKALAYPCNRSEVEFAYADTACSLFAQDFPFTPLTLAYAASSAANPKIYLNAGNLTIQRLKVRSSMSRPYSTNTGTIAESSHTMSADPYSRVFLHDSGSIWMQEIRPPTSAAAGDGIMGVAAGALLSAPAYGETATVWNDPVSFPMFTPPPYGSLFYCNRWLGAQPDLAYSAVKGPDMQRIVQYWQSRGIVYPTIHHARTVGAIATPESIAAMQSGITALRDNCE